MGVDQQHGAYTGGHNKSLNHAVYINGVWGLVPREYRI